MHAAFGGWSIFGCRQPELPPAPMHPEIEHAAVLAFRTLLRRRGREASPLRDMRIDYDVARDHLVFNTLFADGFDYHWTVPLHLPGVSSWIDRPAFLGLTNDLHSLYSRMYEDHLLQLELEPRRQAIYELERSGARSDLIWQAREEYRLFEQHVRRHHRENPVRYVGVDYGRGPWVTSVTLAGPDAATLNVAAMQRAMQQMQQEVDRAFWANVHYDGSRQAAREAARAADAKGLALLKAWLSPEQLASYERQSHFEVIGSDTGKRYRIRQGRQMNIDELAADGSKVCGWCFLPEGGLVAGDCMLAQKIALETNERAALKVANRFPAGLSIEGNSFETRPGAITYVSNPRAIEMTWIDEIAPVDSSAWTGLVVAGPTT